MTIEVRWYGHGTWGITAGEHRIVLDPFFNDNPKSPIKAEQVEADVIHVLVVVLAVVARSLGRGDAGRR